MIRTYLTAFRARQLARPSGLYGRMFMGARLNRLNAAMNALTFEALRPFDGGPILEVGFGGGALVEELTKAGQPVFGLELSRAMLAYLRRRLPRGSATLYLGDAAEMPFQSCSFAKVCTVNTIYFWRDPDETLAELYRVLRPGGHIVICFNPAEELRRFPVHKFGFALYDVAAVEKLVRNRGFADVHTLTRHDPRQGTIACTVAKRL